MLALYSDHKIVVNDWMLNRHKFRLVIVCCRKLYTWVIVPDLLLSARRTHCVFVGNVCLKIASVLYMCGGLYL